MIDRIDKKASRENFILKELQQTGSVSVEKLCEMLEVSMATVRRDLQDLELRGLLRRTHGGAVAIEPLFYEPFRHDQSFQDQVGSYAEEKRRIAHAAAELVMTGETIALTAGTTTTEVVRNLRTQSGITVVTNTVNIAMELSKRKDIDVFITGGHLRGDWFSMVGPEAIRAMSLIFVDTLFIGVNGIHVKHGLTCLNSAEAEINRSMVRQAKRKIVVTDHSKLDVVTTWQMCAVDEIDMLITDTGAPDSLIKPFEDAGITIKRV